MKIKYRGEIIDLIQTNKPFPEEAVKHKSSVVESRVRERVMANYATPAMKNIIYVKNVFPYVFGELYQAILGLQDFPSRSEDKKETRKLSKYLERLKEEDRYHVLIYKVLSPSRYNKHLIVRAVPWIANYSSTPKIISPNRMKTFQFKVGSYLYIRKNNVDGNKTYYDVEGYCQHNKQNIIARFPSLIWERIKKRVEAVI